MEIGKLPETKKDGVIEYNKVSVNRAQIIFKNTTQSKYSKLNFEQFLYALKQVSLEVYPYSGSSETMYEAMEKTINELQHYENSVFFKMISKNIIKRSPVKANKYEVYKEIGDSDNYLKNH
jgi:hypothetical protein